MSSKKNDEKINRALKSLFRYARYKENCYPDVLLDCERKMLEHALSKLDGDDFYYIIANWADFYIEQAVELEVDNTSLHSEVEHSRNTDEHFN